MHLHTVIQAEICKPSQLQTIHPSIIFSNHIFRNMKIKRQKKVQRTLNFFKHNFGHRPPFQLLIDGTFCQACLTVSERF